ncbi:N-acyl-D-amino-acid deacylase family protein [Woeseia oceani]|uniref:Aminoacylase n=1 Tax=Woeseia oceani TaxID=1548547 RepID=A0A193LFE1_9GAMM|nr:D-aminoacylase [Woeseia oceani]ANO51250.1 aminoacylase [Woeseia oceani]
MQILSWRIVVTALAALFMLGACSKEQAPAADTVAYDLIIRNGMIYDGSGAAPYRGDVAINGDRIAALGDLGVATGVEEVDAAGMAVAPGFINMLSWATESLLEDGRALSDIHQGVTLEIMGEGGSMGPLNSRMKAELQERQGDIRYDVNWTTLGEYLEHLENRGVSVNVASYIGAGTVRVHEVGYDDRRATAEELARMQELVRAAMREGAIGVGSSLIYAPDNFADTNELVALASAAAEYDGSYISHIRSEGNRLEEAVQELIKISSLSGAPAEIYHLKASGKNNWFKLENVFNMIEAARAAGLRISANMYTYNAGATGLDATMPLWVQAGGHDAWVERLKDPQIRERVIAEMHDDSDDWENFYVQAGPENIRLLGFRNETLRPLIGKTLQEVADERQQDPAATAIDLVIEDDSRVDAAFTLMSEFNVSRKAAKPWVSFGSDAGALAAEGVFLNSSPHPRAYGTFARVISRFVREESLMPIEEAVRRMTSLPAFNTNIRGRGRLKADYYADVVIFDPAEFTDHATFEEPHQYATGVEHVFVNGVQVLKDGEHTGATPGRVVRGPGWVGWPDNQPIN